MKKQYTKIIFIGLTGILTCLLIVYLGLITWIKHDAKSFASELSNTFQMDETAALMAVLDSADYSFKDKNHAVWALGVLKEKEALPKLESLYTGEKCNHDSALCQFELGKAIFKIKGEFKGSWQVKNSSVN